MTKRTFNERPRVERGFYPTPVKAFEPLAKVWKPKGWVWEPCAGDGALCYHMTAAGWLVSGGSDILPQHDRVRQLDALAINGGLADEYAVSHFVTNPPWPLPGAAGEPTWGILHHLSALRPTWALLPADWMHNVSNEPLMRRCVAIVSVGRVKWIPDSAHGGFDNACWYLFDVMLTQPEFLVRPTSYPAFIGRQP